MSDSPTAGGKPVSPYLEIGATVGHYRIESFVAHGGMAFVYEATDLRLGRHVALKLLAAPPTRESDFRERFTRESRYAASLDHPNIVPIYEAGEADGLLFIAMRFVSGVNLDSRLREVHRLDGPGALAVLAPIADALDLAHSAGLVHRDVKPANILLTDTGRGHEHVYLTDFGITKHTSGLTKLTATGNVIGTMTYTAPEQIRGDRIDARTDLYALGCVAYQCLTGVAPFVRDNQWALVYAHLNERPAPVSSHRPELAAADPVIARALEKDPAKRFARCADFTDALNAALAGRADGAATEPAGPAVDDPPDSAPPGPAAWPTSAVPSPGSAPAAPATPGPAAAAPAPAGSAPPARREPRPAARREAQPAARREPRPPARRRTPAGGLPRTPASGPPRTPPTGPQRTPPTGPPRTPAPRRRPPVPGGAPPAPAPVDPPGLPRRTCGDRHAGPHPRTLAGLPARSRPTGGRAVAG